MNNIKNRILSILYVSIFIFVICIDQIFKYFADCIFKNSEEISLIYGFLSLRYLENIGAAFGMLKGGKYLFLTVTLIVILFFNYLIFFKKIKNNIFLMSGVFICAGGISNSIDRFFRGYVIDYIKFSFFSPVLNIADIAVSCGVVLIFIYTFKTNNKSEMIS